jgi:hypothetical protein
MAQDSRESSAWDERGMDGNANGMYDLYISTYFYR